MGPGFLSSLVEGQFAMYRARMTLNGSNLLERVSIFFSFQRHSFAT